MLLIRSLKPAGAAAAATAAAATEAAAAAATAAAAAAAAYRGKLTRLCSSACVPTTSSCSPLCQLAPNSNPKP